MKHLNFFFAFFLVTFHPLFSGRDGSCYNNSLFVSEGISILEDLVIGLADGVASIYLELISVDGNMSNEMNNLSSDLCSLSTRSLQKLRNEVSMMHCICIFGMIYVFYF